MERSGWQRARGEGDGLRVVNALRVDLPLCRTRDVVGVSATRTSHALLAFLLETRQCGRDHRRKGGGKCLLNANRRAALHSYVHG